MLDNLALDAADVMMMTWLATGPIHPRTVEHARAVKLGRKPKLTDHQKREAIRRRIDGETVRDIARSYNVSHSTISRLTA
jgi:Helix-turn-helix domain of resolvase